MKDRTKEVTEKEVEPWRANALMHDPRSILLSADFVCPVSLLVLTRALTHGFEMGDLRTFSS